MSSLKGKEGGARKTTLPKGEFLKVKEIICIWNGRIENTRSISSAL